MKTVNTRDIQVGQRIRINLGYGNVCEALVTQKDDIFPGKETPGLIMFTLNDGQVKYALGDVQAEVLSEAK